MSSVLETHLRPGGNKTWWQLGQRASVETCSARTSAYRSSRQSVQSIFSIDLIKNRMTPAHRSDSARQFLCD